MRKRSNSLTAVFGLGWFKPLLLHLQMRVHKKLFQAEEAREAAGDEDCILALLPL